MFRFQTLEFQELKHGNLMMSVLSKTDPNKNPNNIKRAPNYRSSFFGIIQINI